MCFYTQHDYITATTRARAPGCACALCAGGPSPTPRRPGRGGESGESFPLLKTIIILNNRHQRMQWQLSQVPLGVMETLRALGTQTEPWQHLPRAPKITQDADSVESLI